MSAAAVLCVGNLVAGGAGKTPTALTLARTAKKAGLRPGFLSRGYGGGIHQATLVDLKKHNSHDVGDEPLLLAACFPTVISPDRPAGAKLLEQHKVDFIIMDDGFQNPALHKDYSLVVVDALRGIGNGFPIPGGPLRASLNTQLDMASAVLVIGSESGADKLIRFAARRAMPIYEARIVPVEKTIWKGKKALAFAGIGHPDKFFASLEKAGAMLVKTHKFADHHPLSSEMAGVLMEEADREGLEIITTSKDAARLQGRGKAHDALLEKALIFDIRLEFDGARIPAEIVDTTLQNARANHLEKARNQL